MSQSPPLIAEMRDADVAHDKDVARMVASHVSVNVEVPESGFEGSATDSDPPGSHCFIAPFTMRVLS